MRKLLVTGSNGLVGWHTLCRLSTLPDCQVVAVDRHQFNDPGQLQSAVSSCDAIIHLAGVNRGTDAETEFENPAIAQRLVDACNQSNSRPHIIYSSTIHTQRDTPYGRGKKNAGLILEQWATSTGSKYTNFVLPHIFGEHGRPRHNSVVSTFAWQIANGESPTINQDGDLNLMHAQAAASLFIQTINQGTNGTLQPDGVEIRVSELLDRLHSLAARYQSGVVPNLGDSLDHRLFNTYRSYIPYTARAIPLQLRSDNRGHLFETIRTDSKGQVFISSTHPGITRGNHFHTRKVERFIVVEGEATIRLRRLLSSEVVEYPVRGDQPVAIDIPTLHTHNITNTGSGPLWTLFWSHEHFDQADSDTYACDVAIAETE